MLIRAKVFPDASKNYVEEDNDRLKIFVKDAPFANQANKRARILVAHHYHIELDAVTIVLGHRSTHKTFEIKNTD